MFPLSLSRRTMLLGAACAGVCCAWPPSAAARPDPAAALAEIERRSGGRLGLFALDTGTGRTLGHRADERFAMCSTFKLLLAAAVLYLDQSEGGVLDRRLAVHRADLIAHSPITSQHLNAGFIAVREACEATVQVSDNAAANLLLPLVGGPGGLTRFLRERCSDAITRADRTEPTLNTNLANDPRDTTTPGAMALTVGRLLTGDVLGAPAREQLRAWLEGSSTGGGRLRAGLPKDWRVGDKTGTGSNGAINDVAAAWPPGRAPIVVAVYLSGSTLPVQALEATHAQAAAIVTASFA